ncbi:Glutathione synthetase [Tilletia horrida]|nr:Glutathione synthetase [Tilletia horrida]
MTDSASVVLPAWPPAFSEDQLRALASASTDYALAHGLVYRPVAVTSFQGRKVPTDSVIHAPFSLLPSPFPRSLFERAHGAADRKQEESQSRGHSLAALYAHLYARVTLDHDFLERVIGANVAKVDEFQGKLWEIYLQVRKEQQEALQAGTPLSIGQRLHLGLFRSDYLLHAPDDDPDQAESSVGSRRNLELKQVEFNTISASFGSLSSRVSELHRHTHTATTAFWGAADELRSAERTLPSNKALQTLAGGLAAAHRAYNEAQQGSATEAPAVLFVVQPEERNAFDQRWLEYELSSTHQIRVLRATFDELSSAASPAGSQTQGGASLQGEARKLFVRLPGFSAANGGRGVEISVVYLRAGYGPDDYPEHGSAWDVRHMLERSAAIKCPTVALQLAGAKKVQQVLAEPGVLEKFLLEAPASSDDRTSHVRFTTQDVDLLRSTFSGLWPLDNRSDLGREGIRLARAEPERFVLKPQREGGGNNVYRRDIPEFLDKLPVGGEEGYILMEIIKPPKGVGNYLMRAGASNEEGPKLARDVISELGVYSTALFGPGSEPEPAVKSSQRLGHELEMVHEGYGGYLLRTKGRDSDEGGVAVGYSVIDSIVLV